MAEGRGQFQWGQTSSLLALTANAHRDPRKTRAFKPKDFNPYHVRETEKPIAKTKDLSILKQVFVDGQQERRRR